MLDDTVTLHTPPPERRRSPVLVLIWVSVIVSHLAFGGIIWLTVSHSQESGYQTRAIEDLTSETDILRREVEIWRVYIETLRTSMLSRGIPVEPLPDLTELRKPKERK